MSVSARDWEAVPADPDETDLGYDIADWGVVRAERGGEGHVMFLPEEEDTLREEAFIVADDESVCDVERWQ